MNVKMTDEQAKRVAQAAINASQPMGLGFLHYDPDHRFTESDIDIFVDGIFLDYVQGRMVKLYMRKNEDGTWTLPDNDPRPDYQSWCRIFPRWKDLLSAAGVMEP